MCFNLLVLVPLAIGLGYGDKEENIITQEGKFAIALLAIIPLAYIIGMGITRYNRTTALLLQSLFGKNCLI